MSDLLAVIDRFVRSCQRPVLSEPGEALLQLRSDNLFLEACPRHVRLQAWDEQRNFVRRVSAVVSESRARLELRTERFGGKPGTLLLLDQSRADTRQLSQRSARQEFREVFRRFLRREFAGFRLAELTTEADLEHTLSPAYPRALLRHGARALAAIAAPEASPVDGVLSFGLIWLDYLRRREPDLSVTGLVLFLPAGSERTTCLRLRHLNPRMACYSVYVYDPEGRTQAVDLADYGNLDTHLEPCRRSPALRDHPLHQALSSLPGIDVLENNDGSLRYRAHGLPFASLRDGEVTFGLETKRRAQASNLSEIQQLASHLLHFRSPAAQDRHHPLYERNPEAWLEAQVRAHLQDLDAGLLVQPVYGQVPAFVAGDRGVLDLLAVDPAGRLCVMELKASQDIHLPLQALDYWMRVKWHLDRHEFSSAGYFPRVELSPQPPRLLLVAPALDFHPSNERVLRYVSPDVPVERLGVGLEWQKQLKVLYRM